MCSELRFRLGKEPDNLCSRHSSSAPLLTERRKVVRLSFPARQHTAFRSGEPLLFANIFNLAIAQLIFKLGSRESDLPPSPGARRAQRDQLVDGLPAAFLAAHLFGSFDFVLQCTEPFAEGARTGCFDENSLPSAAFTALVLR